MRKSITVNKGTTVKLWASPNEGYTFKGWRIGYPAGMRIKGNPITYTADYDTNLYAVFKKEATNADLAFNKLRAGLKILNFLGPVVQYVASGSRDGITRWYYNFRGTEHNTASSFMVFAIPNDVISEVSFIRVIDKNTDKVYEWDAQKSPAIKIKKKSNSVAFALESTHTLVLPYNIKDKGAIEINEENHTDRWILGESMEMSNEYISNEERFTSFVYDRVKSYFRKFTDGNRFDIPVATLKATVGGETTLRTDEGFSQNGTTIPVSNGSLIIETTPTQHIPHLILQ